MNVSRANFLKICGVAVLGRAVDASPLLAAGAGGGPVARPGSAAPPGAFQLRDACADHFRPHLNTTFAVRGTDGARVPLVLARVTERPLAHQVAQFSLTFHAPPGALLPHGTHALEHPAFGEVDLFITPVGSGSVQHPVYEACFSRHIRDVRRTVSHAHRAVSDEKSSTRARNERTAEGGNNTCQIRS